MFSLGGSWDFLSTYPTQQTKRTECCVLGTPSTPEPRYLTVSTSPVLTAGDTSSTITTELTGRILRGILVLPTMNCVIWKCTVIRTQILLLCKQQQQNHMLSIENKSNENMKK